MNQHIRQISKQRLALAQDGQDPPNIGDILGQLQNIFDPVLFINFVVSLLTAVNNFLVRKEEASGG